MLARLEFLINRYIVCYISKIISFKNKIGSFSGSLTLLKQWPTDLFMKTRIAD